MRSRFRRSVSLHSARGGKGIPQLYLHKVQKSEKAKKKKRGRIGGFRKKIPVMIMNRGEGRGKARKKHGRKRRGHETINDSRNKDLHVDE